MNPDDDDDSSEAISPPDEDEEALTEVAEERWTAERLCRASYKDLGSPPEVEQRFVRHLLSSPTCRSSLQVLLSSESKTTRDYSLEIDVFDLIQADPVLGHLLMRFPATLLPLLENAVVSAQKEMQRELREEGNAATGLVKGDKGDGKALPMTRVHARLIHLPPTCCKPSLASMDASDVGKIVQLSGTVVRTCPVQMYESARTYRCSGKNGCGQTFVAYADLEQRNNALVAPDRCPLFNDDNERCKGNKMQPVENGSVHTDYQEIKIQEAASRIGIGHIPRSLLVKLQHDLVDTCQPGDEVVIVGSLLAQWQQSPLPDVECNVSMALRAHSIRVVQEKGSSAWKNADSSNTVGDLDKLKKEFDAFWDDPVHKSYPIAARDFICKAVCPKLYGLSVIKLALLITLIGGVSSDVYAGNKETISRRGRDPTSSVAQPDDAENDGPDAFQIHQVTSGSRSSSKVANYADDRATTSNQWKGYQEAVQTRRRDQSHILLVGDPGTGKSQFLRFAAALCPRSVLTTGVGTTSAGLTCAAVREGNGKEFALEAGALVLADKGVCCIDEFGCIQEQDRTTIHEAMEQQTLSVAKAGIVCKLNCRATIIAVMNPRDCLYDNQASLSRNTGLGTPLLSRFDLIFKLVDTSDAQRDFNVTKYLLNRAIQGAGFESGLYDDFDEDEEPPWNMEKLRAYISIVKERFQPVMSDDAALLLKRHYERCRAAQSNTIPVTVRFLESLIRLAQAHSRLMYRTSVTLQDAVAVIRVMECTAFTYGGFDGSNIDDFENVMYMDPMNVDFPEQPDLELLCFEYQILKCYHMLDRMPDDKRRLVEQTIQGEYVDDDDRRRGGGSSAWDTMENPRDRRVDPPSTVQAHDHYGRLHFFSQAPNPTHKASHLHENSDGDDCDYDTERKRRRNG